ncbi:hypothetical protein B0H67DRAFT_237448 [Lasiosphaeris hirsuta]|uniref:Transmembrane protein n=1 Tax=Lasiosphaeris hirsuta TaxID=260670 RepID=A0AA40AG53_9PEZI|nr:hypothetical protein B0H67DRAFT_237448 [Lasiosphaeris hirsuta]
MPSVHRLRHLLSRLLLSFWVAQLQHGHAGASPVPRAVSVSANQPQVGERAPSTQFDPARSEIWLRFETAPTRTVQDKGMQKRQAVVTGPYSTVSAGPGGASAGSGTADPNDPDEDVGRGEEGLTTDQKIAIAVPIAVGFISVFGGSLAWYFGKCCFSSRKVRDSKPTGETAEVGDSLDGAKPEHESLAPTNTGQLGGTGGQQGRMSGVYGGVSELPATRRPVYPGGEQHRMNAVRSGATELPTWGGDHPPVELGGPRS